MYIKAEQKPSQFKKNDERADRNKNQRLPDLETDFKEHAAKLDLYKKELNGSAEETLNSLKFLHKPQRVTQMRANRFPEEEVQRNTDLNKRIFSARNDENSENDNDGSSGGPATGKTEVTSSGSAKYPFKIELPPLSPRSTIATHSFETEYPETKSPGNDMNFEYDEEILIPFAPPVYKKSGELLKSSLKRRSKSLPTTPGIRESRHGGCQRGDDSPMLLRSKSVHFNQATPVKYFAEDESPINVNRTEQYDNRLSFKHKPVNLMVDPEEEERMLSLGLETTSIDDDLTTVAPKGFANSAKNPSVSNGNSTNNTKLRKSKRFQNLVKNKTVIPPSKFNKNFTNGGRFDEFQNQGSTNYHVVGLYSKNFPILSNKNPKSLNLNIFINLSQNKKVFLQELSLYIHRDNSSFFNTPSSNNNPEGHNNENTMNKGNNTGCTRLIVGRILVKNIFYDKRVVIRYTWNDWRTAHEVECVYISNGDGILPGTDMDIFHFIIDDASKLDPRGRLEFCIHYSTRNDYKREEYWDNNNGNNYKVEVVMDGFKDPFASVS